jgi:hypothetical protein
VSAFGGVEGIEEPSDDVPERVDGARRGGAEQGFELGEGLLDRVEIWTVGRQVEQMGAGRRDRLTHAGDLVRGEVVHHHEVARAQRRRQGLLDIREEARPVDRAIEHAGCGEAVVAQRGDDGGGFPVGPWGTAATTRRPRGARP